MNNDPIHKQHFNKPALAIAGAAALIAGISYAGAMPGATARSPLDLKVEHGSVDRGRTPAGSFAPIVQKVAPSVVEVFVTSKNSRREVSGEEADLFRHFFGDNSQGGNETSPRQHGLGSGVIISPSGYILTNNHVVDGATEIRVALADGRQFPAEVIGRDPKTDIALVKINVENLPALTLADSDAVAVGDVVLAVGNPFGIGQTVTEGIVSAKDRVTSGSMDEDFIQTDAAINPGNSGGALVDTDGRLVGINTAILSHSGGNQGIGFAVPSNICRWVTASLVKSGKVERGFLGINIQTINPELAKAFKLDKMNGALVSDVRPGGAAESAGLKSGDVIREFNGQAVRDASQLKLLVAEAAPGTKISAQVLRNGELKTIEITLGRLTEQGVASAQPKEHGQREALAGVAVADIDQNARAGAGIPSSVRGALITDVAQDSPASEAGLRPGDVITEINRQPVESAKDAIADTERATGGQTLVKVWSREGSRYLSVEESNG